MTKKLSGNEMLHKVLDELLAMTPEELQKTIDAHSNEKHWAAEALDHAGYFDQFIKGKKDEE